MFWLDSGHQQIDYLDGIEAAVLYGGLEEGVVEGDGWAFGGEVEPEGAEEGEGEEVGGGEGEGGVLG